MLLIWNMITHHDCENFDKTNPEQQINILLVQTDPTEYSKPCAGKIWNAI